MTEERQDKPSLEVTIYQYLQDSGIQRNAAGRMARHLTRNIQRDIERLEADNFMLSAGQCVVEGGLLDARCQLEKELRELKDKFKAVNDSLKAQNDAYDRLAMQTAKERDQHREQLAKFKEELHKAQEYAAQLESQLPGDPGPIPIGYMSALRDVLSQLHGKWNDVNETERPLRRVLKLEGIKDAIDIVDALKVHMNARNSRT